MTHIGSYGLLRLASPAPDYVDSDEEAYARIQMRENRVYRVVSEDGSYLTVQYGELEFRVWPDAFRPVASPAFDVGDVVAFEKGGQEVSGVIKEIGWHYKRDEHIFLIERDGRLLKKRYWSHDLRRGSEVRHDD